MLGGYRPTLNIMENNTTMPDSQPRYPVCYQPSGVPLNAIKQSKTLIHPLKTLKRYLCSDEMLVILITFLNKQLNVCCAIKIIPLVIIKKPG